VEIHDVDAVTLRDAASQLLGQGRRLALVSGHDDGAAGLRVVFVFVAGSGKLMVELHLRTGREAPSVPTLSALSSPASRFERELQDLVGIVPVDHPQPQRLLLHGHWPNGWHPLRADADADPVFAADAGSFPFLEVEGQGVYAIPVGPVHPGLIEPGHFRFWVVGETILRMKARLWFLLPAPRGRAALPGRRAGRSPPPGGADQRRHGHGPRARVRDGGGGRRGDRRPRPGQAAACAAA
jgi:Ni,Fe-hydrogenase III component G